MSWTPFERSYINPADVNKDWMANPGARAEMEEIMRSEDIWVNSIYQVNIRKIPKGKSWPCDLLHLSIKRRDKQVIRDWRVLQRIKNELVGPENEGFEVFPAESRLVDTSNQFHLWVFTDPTVRIPIGFNERWVSEGNEMGSVQRPFPEDAKPADLTSLKDYFARKKPTNEKI